MKIIEWWVSQSGWLKFGIPLGLLVLSSLLLLWDILWFYGFGLGFSLLVGSLYFQDDPNVPMR